MGTIDLDVFFKRVNNNKDKKKIFLEKNDSVGTQFEIISILGKGNNGYVFLGVDNKKKLVALRLSHVKDDFDEKLKTIKKLMGDDYSKYLLELIDPAEPIKYTVIGKEKLFFERDVFMSSWEPAECTLKDKLEEDFDPKLEWFIQFLKGLMAIHSRKRLHLDIKLGNLFLVNNRLKIGDFEFYFKKEDFLNGGQFICGTPGHIAPELFDDDEIISEKCDIFSAGVAFCELFTGSKLPIDLIKRIQRDDPLSDEEKKDLQYLFGDSYQRIVNYILVNFIKNFRVFNFFRQQVEKILAGVAIEKKERKIFELVLRMLSVSPKTRPDVKKLLFKTQEVSFDPYSIINKELVSKRYKVQKLIDASVRGIVFKVLDSTEGVVKAIKLFPPQYDLIKKEFKKIKKELIQTRKLSHHNIVKYFGLERDGDLNFIVMEYINGYTLKKKLESTPGGKLKEVEALKIMSQVADGIKEAHENKVIHRNLKDKNIMIRSDDKMVKIINFGLPLEMKKEISGITGDDTLGKESLLKAPPEQLKKSTYKENEQKDVWGFGDILYQLLVGEHPFDKDDKIRDTATLPTITGISPNTEAVIMKCLENDSKKRYRNMKEVYDDLLGGRLNSQDTVKLESRKKNVKFFKHHVFKLLVGVISFLIAAALYIILGTDLIVGGARYRMWYSGKPGDYNAPGGGIGYAVSRNGISWERYKNNPIITSGKTRSLNEFESEQPYIVHDGIYFHLLFSGITKKENGFEYQIGYMHTDDLNQWDKHVLEKMILDDGKIKFPGPMLYTDGCYKMWYSENNEIYYARTAVKNQNIKDMLRYGDKPVLVRGNDPGDWDKHAVIVGSILYEFGIYRMWYTGKSGEESKIGYATSGDGITWNKYGSKPIFDDMDVTMEMNPCVIHDSKGYKMYYTAATTGSEYWPVRLAISNDGKKWKKYSNIPVLDIGSADWENSKIFVTNVRFEKK